jgi:hypothetical protein
VKASDSIVVAASRERIFEVLCDPECYVRWVVGAGRLRGVDESWPSVGSRFHHTVGIPPFEVQDSTEVRRCEAPTHIELCAMVRPFFEAIVDLRLADVGYGRTRITMTERSTGGLMARTAWMAGPALSMRNRLALRRLEHIVACRAAAESR